MPRENIFMVPSTSINVLLDYVKAGRCQGAVSTSVHLQYGMGLGDIKGDYCDIVYAGDNLGVSYYGLPFNLRVPEENITAYSILANAAISARHRSRRTGAGRLPRLWPRFACLWR